MAGLLLDEVQEHTFERRRVGSVPPFARPADLIEIVTSDD